MPYGIKAGILLREWVENRQAFVLEQLQVSLLNWYYGRVNDHERTKLVAPGGSKVAGRRRPADAALHFRCLRESELDAGGFDNTLRRQ